MSCVVYGLYLNKAVIFKKKPGFLRKCREQLYPERVKDDFWGRLVRERSSPCVQPSFLSQEPPSCNLFLKWNQPLFQTRKQATQGFHNFGFHSATGSQCNPLLPTSAERDSGKYAPAAGSAGRRLPWGRGQSTRRRRAPALQRTATA